MKTSIIYTLILALIFAGCEDILKEEPKAIAVETFYNTPSEIEASLYAIFQPLNTQNCMGGLWPAVLVSFDDIAYGRGSYGILSEYIGLDNNNITRVGSMWILFYRAIRNANIVIANTPNSQISDNLKANYIGEAKFMRAFIYFNLVRVWGAIPMRTEENMGINDLARTPVDQIYSLIVDDLIFAEQNITTDKIGRPSKWAAKTLLAHVYLQLGKWSEAEIKASEVINSAKYSLVEVSKPDDFLKLYGPNIRKSTEEIFYLKFTGIIGNGNWFPMFLHHPGSGYHAAGGYYAHYTDSVKNPVIANWDYNDLRRQFNFYPYNIGLGTTTLLCKKFQDKSAISEFAAAVDYPIYKYSDLLLFYAEANNKSNNGPTELAMECVNKVRRRAYGYSPNKPSPVDYNISDYNFTSFNELILKERGYETVFEGKRWLDLVRLGIAEEVIKSTKDITVAKKHYLWPIPINETNYNDLIDAVSDQNPGY